MGNEQTFFFLFVFTFAVSWFFFFRWLRFTDSILKFSSNFTFLSMKYFYRNSQKPPKMSCIFLSTKFYGFFCVAFEAQTFCEFFLIFCVLTQCTNSKTDNGRVRIAWNPWDQLISKWLYRSIVTWLSDLSVVCAFEGERQREHGHTLEVTKTKSHTNTVGHWLCVCLWHTQNTAYW